MASAKTSSGNPKRITKRARERARAFLYNRAVGYTIGFILFYAPFALFARLLGQITGQKGADAIHDTCLRIPIQKIIQGDLDFWTTRGLSILLLTGLAVAIGPYFCGRICPTGAVTEYLSRPIPDRFNVDWAAYINPAGIRYGFLVGFVISPFLGGSIACAFCGYSFLEKIANGNIITEAGILGSPAIITGFLWLIVFGLFTKGGRGYCSFLCPVGAYQNAIHSVSSRLPFTGKLRLDASKCTSCGHCVENCPMSSLRLTDDHLKYNIHTCLTCRQCIAGCPSAALSFGTGESGFSKALPVVPEKITTGGLKEATNG